MRELVRGAGRMGPYSLSAAVKLRASTRLMMLPGCMGRSQCERLLRRPDRLVIA